MKEISCFTLAALALALPARAENDPSQCGGEPDGIVQVANLVYAGKKSSRCFSDHFLIKAEQDTAISTSRRFHAVKLSGEDVYQFLLLIMTGEGNFQLSEVERESLRRYVERGGLLLASAGCSPSDTPRRRSTCPRPAGPCSTPSAPPRNNTTP